MEASTGVRGDTSKVWTISLQVLGAAAGIVALATFVGGATLWLRFQALDLPADRAVAVLPKELLVVVGAHALILPVALGLAALVVLAVIDPTDDEGNIRRNFARTAIAATVLGLLIGIATTWGMQGDRIAIAILAAGVALFLIAKTVTDKKLVRYTGWIVFAVFALYGALLGILQTAEHPEMEPVAALLTTEDRGLAGFFVGETDERLWFVSLPGNADPGDPFADAPVDRVVGVPRSEITTIVTREPVGVGEDDSGREQAFTLLADLRFTMQERQRDTKVEPVVTTNPEIAFAPLVHLHSDEDLLPISARGFIDNSLLRWSNKGSDCGSVTLAAGASRRDDAPEAPAIRDEWLGATEPYEHTPHSKCMADPRAIRATGRTRPYEKTRAKGLALTQGYYLDLEDDQYGGHDEIEDEGPRSFLRNVPVYADTETDPVLSAGELDMLPRARRDDAVRITYWMLYALSEPPGTEEQLRKFNHEGDWEAISVLLLPPDAEAGDAKQKKGYLPIAARYNYHNHKRVIPWYAVKRVVGDTDTGDSPTHPVVYSAEGSHASYWQAGSFEEIFKPTGKPLITVDDVAISCPECPQWQTWKIVLPARDQLWYGFAGAWGKVGFNSDTTGPLGPSNYKLGVNEPVEKPVPGDATPLPSAPTEIEDQIRAGS